MGVAVTRAQTVRDEVAELLGISADELDPHANLDLDSESISWFCRVNGPAPTGTSSRRNECVIPGLARVRRCRYAELAHSDEGS